RRGAAGGRPADAARHPVHFAALLAVRARRGGAGFRERRRARGLRAAGWAAAGGRGGGARPAPEGPGTAGGQGAAGPRGAGGGGGAAAFLYANQYEGYGPETGSIAHDREAPIPGVSIAREDAAYLERLLERNGSVTLRITTTDRSAPARSWNVCGELPGGSAS